MGISSTSIVLIVLAFIFIFIAVKVIKGFIRMFFVLGFLGLVLWYFMKSQ